MAPAPHTSIHGPKWEMWNFSPPWLECAQVSCDGSLDSPPTGVVSMWHRWNCSTIHGDDCRWSHCPKTKSWRLSLVRQQLILLNWRWPIFDMEAMCWHDGCGTISANRRTCAAKWKKITRIRIIGTKVTAQADFHFLLCVCCSPPLCQGQVTRDISIESLPLIVLAPFIVQRRHHEFEYACDGIFSWRARRWWWRKKKWKQFEMDAMFAVTAFVDMTWANGHGIYDFVNIS